ncbi:DUF3574 domain-containing protein [Microbulbifer agarilyticus]|uniref:DUF3574 domain-containing protein n=1 Tax=Microbulbifer agarilyticus TaxID=260552 RepID=UPI001CD614E2|nr:DUF3574 domain-containing protein [Microbulbifer agarilyticus]MCA0892618.1 DUF3574 domain-containing protein [Microbulbifer agarilyticus]
MTIACRLCLLACLTILGGCGTTTNFSCKPGEKLEIHDQLFFGTETFTGEVSDAEWRDFLANVVSPRFPNGFTVLSGRGQWRGSSGEIVRERSKVLLLVHRETAKSDTAINELVDIYKRRFQQESVLRVRSPVCVSFR